MRETIDDREVLIEKFYFYKSFFSQKQITNFELYYFDDLSIVEIGKINNISRIAVSDSINNTKKQIINLENKLHLWEKHKQAIILLKQIETKDNIEIIQQLINLY